LWEELNDRAMLSELYRPDAGENLHRRSLYTYWKRSVPPPMLAIFDAPSREATVVKRERTDTPLQALALLNEPLVLEASRAFAEKMSVDADPRSAIARGYQMLFLRAPSEGELEVLLELYEAELASPVPMARLRAGDAPRRSPHGADVHAALSAIARAMFNTSEAVTKE
jgi:hypothetical protein